MKLTRHIIADLAEILGGIKINRIDDKEAKAVLLKDYLSIRKVARETESDRLSVSSKRIGLMKFPPLRNSARRGNPSSDTLITWMQRKMRIRLFQAFSPKRWTLTLPK